ncbi:MAG: DUF2523 domain-containing protein [Steroidobacteraceae bacterium]
MPAILAFLRSFLSISVAQVLVSRLFVAAGVTAVTYVGVTAALDTVEARMVSAFAGLPADVWAVVTITKFPQACSLVLSAIVGRTVLNGLTAAGSIRKLQVNGPGA